MSKISILVAFCALLIFTGCSKDKMLEKRIHKKEGKWNIVTLHYTLIYQTSGGQQTKIGTINNAGTFTFDKDNGTYSYEVEGFTRSGSFTWAVDDQKVNITSVKQSFDLSTSSFKQTSLALSGTEPEKNKLNLDGSEVDQQVGSSVEQFALTGTFILEKQ